MALSYPHEPGAKVEGTSREAAESMKPTAATLRDAVMKLLKSPQYILHGLTADEAAMLLNESVLSIRPRFSELVGKGEIKALSGRTQAGATPRCGMSSSRTSRPHWLCK